MTAQPVSRSSLNPAGSPIHEKPRIGAIAKAAETGIRSVPSASSDQPLAGAGSSRYDWQGTYDRADQLLAKKKYVEARALYKEIMAKAKLAHALESHAQVSFYSFHIAACEIGIAASYITNSTYMSPWMIKAKQRLDGIFASRGLWDKTNGQAIKFYNILVNLLSGDFYLLSDPSLRPEIEEKIILCKIELPSQPIPHLLTERLTAGSPSTVPPKIVALSSNNISGPLIRLFAWIAVAAIAVIAVDFYRRFIVKID